MQKNMQDFSENTVKYKLVTLETISLKLVTVRKIEVGIFCRTIRVIFSNKCIDFIIIQS